MILDTSFIIDVLRGEETALKKLQKLEENNEPLNITSISIIELWSGIEQSAKSKKEQMLTIKYPTVTIHYNLMRTSAFIPPLKIQ